MKRTYQREVMRRLYDRHGGDMERVVQAYAEAERRGAVPRESNTHNLDAETYARALWRDGRRRGWLPN